MPECHCTMYIVMCVITLLQYGLQHESQISTVNFNHLVCSQGLQLKISRVGRDRQDAHGVGMAETSLPTLNSDDSSSCLDDVQRKRVLQAEPDTVVNLDNIHQFQLKARDTCLHLSATDSQQFHVAQGTRMDNIHGGDGFGARSARSE